MTSLRTSTMRRGALALAATALLLAACGSNEGDVVGDPESERSSDPGDVVATGDAGGSTDAADDASGGAGGVEQTRPIEFTGAPLAPYDSTIPDDTVGAASPVVDGRSFDGTALTIGGPTETPTMLVFLAHWCPHCNDEVPELIELEEDGRIPDDLEVIGISTAVQQGQPNYPPSEWADDKGWLWPMMADDDQAGAFLTYGGTGFPYTVLLDADGTVLARKSGSSSADAIEAWITEYLP